MGILQQEQRDFDNHRKERTLKQTNVLRFHEKEGYNLEPVETIFLK